MSKRSDWNCLPQNMTTMSLGLLILDDGNENLTKYMRSEMETYFVLLA